MFDHAVEEWSVKPENRVQVTGGGVARRTVASPGGVASGADREMPGSGDQVMKDCVAEPRFSCAGQRQALILRS